MAHEHYNVWLDATRHMPENSERMYWVTDGNDIALATWSIQEMQWRFRWMRSLVKPTHFMPIKLEKPPNYTGEHIESNSLE
jgi:hypothetical protein